jgi:hypothetical protein
MSSTDPAVAALDRITLKDWLERRRLPLADPALVPELLLPRRLRHPLRQGLGLGRPALLLQPLGPGRERRQRRLADLARRPGAAGRAHGRACGVERHAGTVVSLRRTAAGVEALCFTLEGGMARSYLVRARKAICAMPVYVAARVVEGIRDLGFDPKRHTPSYAPWMVANFLMKAFPRELPHAPLSWDNVVYGEPGLGYVVSTHQDIRVRRPRRPCSLPTSRCPTAVPTRRASG